MDLTSEELDDLVSNDLKDDELSKIYVCEWLSRTLDDINPCGEASVQETITLLTPETFEQAISLTTRANLGFVKDILMKYKDQMLAVYEERQKATISQEEEAAEKARIAAEEKEDKRWKE